jgi:sec-independent protein translocase protein TatC
MLLTPPDIISQTLLAVPMWLLFELGLIFSRILRRRVDEAKELSEEEMEDELEKAIAEEDALNKDD